MNGLDQVLKILNEELQNDPDVFFIDVISNIEILVKLKENNFKKIENISLRVLTALGGFRTPSAPHVIAIIKPVQLKVHIKPGEGSKKTASGAFYGILEKMDLSQYDTSKFREVSSVFASGKLPSAIKEQSDALAVSEFNRALDKVASSKPAGADITIGGMKFKGVVGVIPITNGEPKADFCFVCKEDNTLYPDCFISYKKGTNAAAFLGYSGLTEQSIPNLFGKREVVNFFKRLKLNEDLGIQKDEYQIISDSTVKAKAVFGKDYGGPLGLDNVHFVCQGTVKITSAGTVTYTHLRKNGNMRFSGEYAPVFGARIDNSRRTKGPKGITIENMRIGIFPRGLRREWMK